MKLHSEIVYAFLTNSLTHYSAGFFIFIYFYFLYIHIYMYYIYTIVATWARFRLKQMWRLMKAMADMKCEHQTKRWNWSVCTKLALSGSLTHGLIAQLLRAAAEWNNSVIMGSNHIYIYTIVATWARFRLKQMWRLMKAMANMKCEHQTKRWNWSVCTKD